MQYVQCELASVRWGVLLGGNMRTALIGGVAAVALTFGGAAFAQESSDNPGVQQRETVTVLTVAPSAEATAAEPAADAVAAAEATAADTPVVAQAPAAAEPALTCGGLYRIKRGDTLSDLARKIYGRASDWSLIYYANQAALGGTPSIIYPGVTVKIPCTASQDPAVVGNEAAPAPIPDNLPAYAARFLRQNSVTLLTADDYRPFTDRSLPAGGLVTEVVETAMTDAKLDHTITWINDWAAHLDPLLMEQHFDAGFPWLKPQCETDPENYRCKNFLFSDPVFEILVTVFVRPDSNFTFETDDSAIGKRFCRPAGYWTHDFDENGRNWLAEDKIVLLQPQTLNDCFKLLEDGVVDAVTDNEFTARQTIAEMGIQDKVLQLPRALSVQNLNVIMPKTHPKATVTLYKFNEALKKLKETGKYQEIVGRHLALFWRDNT